MHFLICYMFPFLLIFSSFLPYNKLTLDTTPIRLGVQHGSPAANKQTHKLSLVTHLVKKQNKKGNDDDTLKNKYLAYLLGHVFVVLEMYTHTALHVSYKAKKKKGREMENNFELFRSRLHRLVREGFNWHPSFPAIGSDVRAYNRTAESGLGKDLSFYVSDMGGRRKKARHSLFLWNKLFMKNGGLYEGI